MSEQDAINTLEALRQYVSSVAQLAIVIAIDALEEKIKKEDE